MKLIKTKMEQVINVTYPKELGLVKKIKSLLTVMIENGIWLTKKLIDKILVIANE
jgi:predicted nucleic acid-binding protein